MIYFFYGDEEYSISKEIEKLKQELDPNFIEMSYKVVDNPSMPDLIAELRTPAMMFGKMLIVIKCEKYLVNSKKDTSVDTKADDKILKQVVDAIEDAKANENIDIVFRAYVDTSDNKPSIDKRKKLFKTLTSCKTVKEFNKIPAYKTRELEAWVLTQAKQKSIKLSQEVVSQLVFQIGNNFRQLDTELEKLKVFAGENTITKDMVKEFCISNEDVFDFLDYVIKEDKISALSEYNKLITKKYPLEIIALCQTMIGKKIQLKVLSKTMSIDELSRELKMHSYRVQMELKDVKKIPLKRLVAIRQNMLNAEYKIKSGQALDIEREVEYAILR